MTLIEKKTIISALTVYIELKEQEEERLSKTGNLKESARALSEALTAHGFLCTMNELLTIPCGKAKI